MQSQQPELPPLPHLALCVSVLAGEVPTSDKRAPEWVKVTPRGVTQTRDGRRYSFTPETLAARFQADSLDIPVDLNHAIAIKGTKGEAVDAVGWVKELQARADGTYGRVEWLDAGKNTLAARTHRYVSPTFHHDEKGEATWLHSVSLLAAPALSMPALASAEVQSASSGGSAIALALGLDASADEAACLDAIGELRAAFVPAGLFYDAIASLNAANGSLVTFQAEARSKRVEGLLEGALKGGKILPFQRETYAAMCATDAGLVHVETLLSTAPVAAFMRPSGLDARKADPGSAEAAETLMVRAARYRDAQAAAGIALTHAEAVRFVHENPDADR